MNKSIALVTNNKRETLLFFLETGSLISIDTSVTLDNS